MHVQGLIGKVERAKVPNSHSILMLLIQLIARKSSNFLLYSTTGFTAASIRGRCCNEDVWQNENQRKPACFSN